MITFVSQQLDFECGNEPAVPEYVAYMLPETVLSFEIKRHQEPPQNIAIILI